MSIEFKLPEVAEGVDTADVAEVHVSAGDVITAGTVVMEVETEKAAVDIECPHAGRIAEVHVQAGDSVPVGGVLLTIEQEETADTGSSGSGGSPAAATSGESAAADSAGGKQPVESSMAEAAAGSGSSRASGSDEEGRDRQSGTQDEALPTTPATTETATYKAISRMNGDQRERPPAPAGPATRRLARKLGVDLYQVQGSGRGGRVTAENVQDYVRSLTTQLQKPSAAPAGTSDISTAMAAEAAPPMRDFSRYGEISRERMNRVARTSAERLAWAWRTIPHVTQHELVDITDIEASRRRYLETSGKSGPKITMTAIMIKACVAALKEFPRFNSSLDAGSGELILKNYYHIGVAVDTDAGLLVPVIRDCDRKTVLQIAGELNDIAGRARDRKLSMEDMEGGTFTITNLGGIGGSSFTPIVNWPEVAILGMSRSQKQPALRNGELVERLMLPLSLSYDHRVINGADAARFIVRLNQSLSDFFRLVIEG